jgi:hypothetical protein
MSKGIKTIASIALPIALSVLAPGLGTALGGAILGAGAAGSATLGGALIGGATGALTGGGWKGAALGALSGGFAPNAGDIASSVLGGTQVGDFFGIPAGIDSAASAYGPTASGASSGYSAGENALLNSAAKNANAPIGAVNSGGIAKSLGANIGSTSTGLSVLNGLSTYNASEAAKEAAKIQSGAVDKAIATNAPYNELGKNAAAQIQQIQADPGAYVQNNPFYKSLADDAQQRLLANQAAKGKIASGGTADALQTSLLNLGNGLVQQQVGTLQNQVNSGQNAAATTGGYQIGAGNAGAAGAVGSANALQTGYQNQIATLLALQNLSKAPSYQPGASYNF